MSGSSPRYRGFISYSQKDKKFAKRLHKALEAYRLPGGKKLGRFFRDDDELGSASSLGAALEGAIKDSEDLIVIASPASAQSKWVNQEVIHFKKLADPEKQVHAVIIGGEAHAAEVDEECFVPALKYYVEPDGRLTNRPDEPLAPDARTLPFKKLVTKLVAGLVEVPFDDLWQRQKRRAQRRMAAGLAAVLAVGIPAGWWALSTTNQLQTTASKLESLSPEVQRANFLDAHYTRLYSDIDPQYHSPKDDVLAGVKIQASEDLNGDGYLDFFVMTEHIDFCGSSGCLQELVIYDEGAYRSVFQAGGIGNLETLETSSNGFLDVAFVVGTTEEGANVFELHRYDGTRYEPGAYAVCDGLSTYCQLSAVFTGSDNTLIDMAFQPLPVDDGSASTAPNLQPGGETAGYVYKGVYAAQAAADGTAIGAGWDIPKGISADGAFTLIQIWKGSFGVRRNVAAD